MGTGVGVKLEKAPIGHGKSNQQSENRRLTHGQQQSEKQSKQNTKLKILGQAGGYSVLFTSSQLHCFALQTLCSS